MSLEMSAGWARCNVPAPEIWSSTLQGKTPASEDRAGQRIAESYDRGWRQTDETRNAAASSSSPCKQANIGQNRKFGRGWALLRKGLLLKF